MLRNDTARDGHARVRLVGVKSNRNGIGARVTITAQGRTQMREVKSGSSYLGQNDLRVHFGLGDAARMERIDVAGRRETRDDPRRRGRSDRDCDRREGAHGPNCVRSLMSSGFRRFRRFSGFRRLAFRVRQLNLVRDS